MSTQRVRRGMHVRLNWPILRASAPEDFSNAESLTLHISRVNNNVKTFIPETHISITGNMVSFIVTSEMQKALTPGDYKATIAYRKVSATSPTLWEPYVKDEACFTLVESSSEVGGSTTGMEVVTIELDGEIGLPKEALPGASAYKIALAHGFEGDESEWLLSLKQPAIDAAAAALQAAGAANGAAGAANTAASELAAINQFLAEAESGRNTAEGNRETKEGQRNQAEQTRNTKEAAREQAEQHRSQSESTRDQSEQSRSTAEVGRSQAETLRYQSELDRKQADTNRENAEQTRETKEGARNQAEQDRETKEGERNQAESSRNNAESDRDQAEQARTLAEQDRKQSETERGTTFTNKIQESEQATAAANTAAGAQNTYNVTVAIPLAAGSYYTKSTARAAVPAVSRKLGLVLTYSTADKVWYSEKYIGSTVAVWTTDSNWEQVTDAAKLNALETNLNKGNLLATYTHSSNLEVAATSLDVATGIFTKVSHGLINGDNISPIMNTNTLGLAAITVFPSVMPNDNYYVVDSTLDTFRISATLNGPAVLFTANSSMDLTKWHFEKVNGSGIAFTNLPNLTSFRFNFTIKSLINAQFYIANAYPDSFTKSSDTNPYDSISRYNAILIPKSHWGVLEVSCNFELIRQMSFRGNCVGYSNTPNSMKITSIDRYFARNANQIPITKLDFQNVFFANGAIIKLYKY